jgi:cbb3-type cytochrome oxidase maturation protein
MDVIYRLIPGMLLLGLVFIAILFWAIKRGQYDDLEGDAHRFLMDDDEHPPSTSGPGKKPDDGTAASPRKSDRDYWPDAD